MEKKTDEEVKKIINSLESVETINLDKTCTLPEHIKRMTGGCCCECEYQRTIYSHPDFDGNTISRIFAYGCSMQCFGEEKCDKNGIIIMSEKHSSCEMFTHK